MAVVICSYPDNDNPGELFSRLEFNLRPFVIRISDEDVYEKTLARMGDVLAQAGWPEIFLPVWNSMKRDASNFGPRYRYVVERDGQLLASGSVARKSTSLICDDPIPVELLNRFVAFAGTIDDATVEVEDDAGNEISLPA